VRRCYKDMMKQRMVLIAAYLSGCGVRGNGNIVESGRNLETFKRVAVSSTINLRVSAGPRAVTVRTDENLQEYVETLVEGETLIVRSKRDLTLYSPVLEVAVANEIYEKLEASGASTLTGSVARTPSLTLVSSGAGTVSLDGVSSDDIKVEASGSSDISIRGEGIRGVVVSSGSSHVKCEGVALQSLQVTASGSSSISARVSAALTGEASGASSVDVVGAPQNSVKKSGAADVKLRSP
jgi:Putative auto-transporter adhesin, head GIN domain